MDCLMGVTLLSKGEYTLVQYRPTDKHKNSAGLKIEPVMQINTFLQMLHTESVPLEACLHTVLPLNKKFLWIRLSLMNLTELSMESLWMVKGVVRLYSKERLLTIGIEDRALDLCVLDPTSQLLSAHELRSWTDGFLRDIEQGVQKHRQYMCDTNKQNQVDLSTCRAVSPQSCQEQEMAITFNQSQTGVNGEHTVQKGTVTEIIETSENEVNVAHDQITRGQSRAFRQPRYGQIQRVFDRRHSNRRVRTRSRLYKSRVIPTAKLTQSRKCPYSRKQAKLTIKDDSDISKTDVSLVRNIISVPKECGPESHILTSFPQEYCQITNPESIPETQAPASSTGWACSLM